MKKALQITLVLAGIIALSLVEISIMFWSGGKDVHDFCMEIKPGLPVSQIADLAKEHNVRYVLPGSVDNSGGYRVLVSSPRSFGRHTCLIRHDHVRVIESRYGYAD